MITKQDILDRAGEWQLRPDVVEKDYVLGWLLAAIGAAGETRDGWVFKGGTCIKKCFFETYRFSEDLDFSLLPQAPYAEETILQALRFITTVARDQSGVDFPLDSIRLDTKRNKQGQPTYQARISYRGPMGGPPSLPRVLLDITRQEQVLDSPVRRTIFHPYPDDLGPAAGVLTYAPDELLAEKTRALYERTRPRDLYDVVYLLENQPEAFNLARTRDLFGRKCASKGLPVPSTEGLLKVVRDAEELRSEWTNMLAHQLPQLPSLDDVLARLPELLRWIDQPTVVLPVVALSAPPVAADAELIPLAGIRYWGTGSGLETLRFAGSNRLIVEFDYHGKHRHAEPYSLRRASTGNVLFYGHELGSHIKAFKVSEMMNVRATTQTFQPRYRIELTSAGGVFVPPAAGPPRSASSGLPVFGVRSTRRHGRPHTGPTHIYRCSYCQKEFRHSKQDSSLRKHKMPDSSRDCPGGRGYFLRTEWS